MLLLTNGLNGMRKSDLRPDELAYIKSRAVENWVRFFMVFRDGFVSVMAFKLRTSGRGKKRHTDLFVKEAHRWEAKSDKHYECDYFFRRVMDGGFTVLFDKRDLHRSLRYCYENCEIPRHGLKPSKRYKSGSFKTCEDYEISITMEEYQKWIRKNVYKYFAVGKNADITKFSIWDFCTKYMQNLPYSEVYCKIGHPVMSNWDRVCKLKPDAHKKFVKWLNKVDQEIYYDKSRDNARGRRSQIWEMFRNNYTLSEYREALRMKYIADKFAERVPKTIEAPVTLKDLAKYFRKQYGDNYPDYYVVHYFDFIDLANELNCDMTSRGVWLPKSINERFSELRELKKKQADKERNIALRQTCKKVGIEKKITYKNGFSFIIPTTQNQFMELGDKLNICVGVCGYAEKVIKGQSLIVGVWKDGKPVNCIELRQPTKEAPTYQTLQNRGAHNRDSEYQEQVTKQLSAYIRMANKQWRTIHGIA